jgi:hypothetical protein
MHDHPQGAHCQTVAQKVRIIQQSAAADIAARVNDSSPRRVLLLSYCGSRWGRNSDYNYFVNAMVRHLGEFFTPIAEVYELSAEWDWRCPPSILGQAFASVDQRDTQTVYFQCNREHLASITETFRKWPMSSVQKDLPDLASRVYHHVWYVHECPA